MSAELRSQLLQNEAEMYDLLMSLGQKPVVDKITDINILKKLCIQTAKLNSEYPNGLTQYVSNARDLIEKSYNEINPYDGFVPSIPTGKTLKFGSPEFNECEAIGFHQLKHTGFVLVAGGLGERLGYDGIKLSLSSELSTEITFIELYIQTILTYQKITGADKLPLFIMTSDQTDKLTRDFLLKHNNYGMKSDQITICKQNGVPAILNRDIHFVIDNGDIICKPHGHGDVHILLHSSGTAKKWLDNGINYIVFFQDTNGLAFHGIPALIGTSHLLDLEVNSLTISRQAKEKVGGICTLSKSDGKKYTINVEYNQLDSLIKSIDPRGDVNDPITGNSPYPGNINVLCFKLYEYVNILNITSGNIPEFINPKWTSDKSEFKSPARLESMMQDYPKLLSSKSKVGFTTLDRWLCFSAVKNSSANAKIQYSQCGMEESLASGEMDTYKLHINHLISAGCTIGRNCRVVITPKCGVTAAQITSHFGNGLTLHDDSTLVIDGNIRIEHLEVRGSLILKSDPHTIVIIRHLKIENEGWSKVEVEENDSKYDMQTRSRGYYYKKNGTEIRVFSGHYQIIEEY